MQANARASLWLWPFGRRAPTSPHSRTAGHHPPPAAPARTDRKSTRLNSSHVEISYAVFCLKKKPVDGITVAGNLRDMFMAVEAVGSDVDPRSHIRTGSILVGGMTVAGSN